jgi:hypothetical protein
VIQKAAKTEKEEATKTGAKLKEKERGQRSWAAGARILANRAHMARNATGRGPHGPPQEFDRTLLSERRKDTDEEVPKEDTSDNDSVGSAGSSSGSLGVERGVEPKNQE